MTETVETGILSTSKMASLKAAAIAGIDRFIGRAKAEQRQEFEIRLWNKEVDRRNAGKRALKAARKADRKAGRVRK